jgi:acid phosphatase family membrane protein YuiD
MIDFTPLFAIFFPLCSGLAGMGSAQILKIVIACITHRKIDLSLMVSAGGMPSSHSAMVTALTFSIGIQEGFTSAAFAISFIFSMIVLYDAAGVRYAAGKQAFVLNKIQEILVEKGNLDALKLKETLGHTKKEVTVGVLLGIAVSLLMYIMIVSG